ncbi:MAG: DUF5916 domain-containing protein [Vicinamibacterales bacterium]
MLLLLANTAWTQPNVSADPSVRTAVVTAITSPIAVDGVLDETPWVSAPPIGDLVQRQPSAGQPPTERTVVTLLHDRDNLYIGVVAYDQEPDRIVATQMARDGSVGSDDNIEILLDTFRDQRSAFYFATNPAGVYLDGLAFSNGQLNLEWDAIWNVRTRRTSEGWVAEFAIPFKSLGFPAGQSVWGFNLSRSINRKLEDDRWSGARFQTTFLQVSEAGQITHLMGLSQGLGLNLRPFLAGRTFRFADGRPDTTNGKPGLDLFYNITPSLKLTGTFNTDFGETEVDARQINLTRFSLLFPEKRTFFLEGAGVFAFASTGPEVPGGIPATGADVFPFFSRQIGLLSGAEVPIDAGAKLTGTIGRTDIGVIDLRTRDLSDENGRQIVEDKNFFVGRIKRNLFRQSYVGAIFTSGNPAAGRSGETYGVDMRLATSRFLGRPLNFIVNAYAAKSSTPGRHDRDWSYGFSAHYPNDRYLAQIVLRENQRNFQPPLGFVGRSNIRLLRVAGSFNPRPKRFLNILQLNHDVFYTQFTRLETGLVESSDLYITWWDWHFRSGDNIHGILDLNPIYERLFEPFVISPGVVLQPGEYRFTRSRTNLFQTANRRRLSGGLTFWFGNYWSGKAEQVQGSLTFRLPPKLTLGVNTTQTFARLPEGHFTARIVTATANYTFSPLLAFTNLIQYDNRSTNLGWQSRIRWTLEPGNDLFLSFNQGWIREEGDSLRFQPEDTRFSAKFQYTVRF